MAPVDLQGRLGSATTKLQCVFPAATYARVNRLTESSLEISGFAATIPIGQRLTIEAFDGRTVAAEILAYRNGAVSALAFESLLGVSPGATVAVPVTSPRNTSTACLAPCEQWLGRIIDPLGRPLDGKGALPRGTKPCGLRAPAPPAAERARLGKRLAFGVSAIDVFAACRIGQRLGLFAGSGVGKSTLLAQMARSANCDIVVLALIGERGREVREFVEDDLGSSGLARSVVVAATSDMSALMRREAAFTATAISEYFRDQGYSVLLLMDSLTRFCLALREIGLSAGEVPATRGYPPSVFAMLPCLLERAGPGLENKGQGQITALYTVLVEGDDLNEPVTDAVRGLLDGHIVLDRRIGERGRYPAIDVLASQSRTMPGCLTSSEWKLVSRARSLLATYAEVSDLVRLGAYKKGADPDIDEAVRLAPRIESVLRQSKDDVRSSEQSFISFSNAMADDSD